MAIYIVPAVIAALVVGAWLTRNQRMPGAGGPSVAEDALADTKAQMLAKGEAFEDDREGHGP
jgi:hypothetical protein